MVVPEGAGSPSANSSLALVFHIRRRPTIFDGGKNFQAFEYMLVLSCKKLLKHFREGKVFTTVTGPLP